MLRNKWQQKHKNLKHVGCSESSAKRDIYHNTSPPQETRKTNKTPNPAPEAAGKRRTKTPTSVEGKNLKDQSRSKWKTMEATMTN